MGLFSIRPRIGFSLLQIVGYSNEVALGGEISNSLSIGVTPVPQSIGPHFMTFPKRRGREETDRCFPIPGRCS